MSRRARFSQALASGLLGTGLNTVYTLLSIPLALAYLSTTEFALWVVVAQLTGYLGLFESCLSGSISRILIEHKGSPNEYAATVKSGFIASGLQGALAALLGLSIAPWIANWVDIPTDLTSRFNALYIGQCILLGFGCTMRMFSYILIAHQRQEIVNHAQSLSFVAMFLVQWYAFANGAGVFGLFWGALAGALVNAALPCWAALALKFCPPRVHVAKMGQRFREILGFSAELLLQVLGWQLIAASQIILVKIFLGLEAAATYAVCTKAFFLAQAVAYRVVDFSVPALSDMAARGESERLRTRFVQITTMSGAIAAMGSVLLAAGNHAFVAWWTNGRIGWPVPNDWLLGGLLFMYSVNRVHGGLAWVVKQPRHIRAIFPLEGLFVITFGALATGIGGIPWLLASCILCNFVFSGLLGARSSSKISGLPIRVFFHGLVRPALVLAGFGLVAWVGAGYWEGLAPFPRFVASMTALIPVGLAFTWWIGFPKEIRSEIADSVSKRFPFLVRKA